MWGFRGKIWRFITAIILRSVREFKKISFLSIRIYLIPKTIYSSLREWDEVDWVSFKLWELLGKLFGSCAIVCMWHFVRNFLNMFLFALFIPGKYRSVQKDWKHNLYECKYPHRQIYICDIYYTFICYRLFFVMKFRKLFNYLDDTKRWGWLSISHFKSLIIEIKCDLWYKISKVAREAR